MIFKDLQIKSKIFADIAVQTDTPQTRDIHVQF